MKMSIPNTRKLKKSAETVGGCLGLLILLRILSLLLLVLTVLLLIITIITIIIAALPWVGLAIFQLPLEAPSVLAIWIAGDRA